MLDAGFKVKGSLTYLTGNMDIAFDGSDVAGTVATSFAGGKLAFSMGSDGMSYNVGQEALTLSALMPDVPLPITLNMAQSKLNFAMPLQKSDEEQNFAFGFKMGDFTVPDMLWGIFNPFPSCHVVRQRLRLISLGKLRSCSISSIQIERQR